MAKSLLVRLFGLGKMPEAVLAEIAGETQLLFTEGVRVSLRRRGHVPGSVVAGRAVNVGWGAFAVTNRRVVGTRSRAKWVDVPWDDDDVSEGPAQLTLDATGLHVEFDLAKVHPACDGEMRIDFREQLSDDDLARFPARTKSFRVDPQKVVRLFGSLKKLPDDQA